MDFRASLQPLLRCKEEVESPSMYRWNIPLRALLKRRGSCLDTLYSASAESEFADFPNLNSVVLSIKSFLQSGCISTIDPSHGMKRIIFPTCTSKLESSDTCALTKTGLSNWRDLFHACPSTVRIPSPRKGSHIDRFIGSFPNLATCVAKMVCMLSESPVTYCLVPQLMVCTVFPYFFKRALSVANELPAFISSIF
jgi:hypothetical protein